TDAAYTFVILLIANKYVADLINGEPSRPDELARVETGMGMTEPRQEFALIGIDADPRTAIRQIDIDRHVRSDLADEEARRLGAGLHVEAGRAVHVVPLRLVFAIAVEYLDAVVLAVRDINPAIGVAARSEERRV